MKLPVKDRETIPWMSKREIPAIKAALSAWRKMRKDDPHDLNLAHNTVPLFFKTPPSPEHTTQNLSETIGIQLEMLCMIDKRLFKEQATLETSIADSLKKGANK